MNANIAMPAATSPNQGSFKASSFNGSSDEAGFVGFLTSLITSGKSGEEVLVSLFGNSNGLSEESSQTLNQTLTIGSLLSSLNLREASLKEGTLCDSLNNFIVNDNVEDILSNLKNKSQSMAEENITQFLADGSIDLSFIKMKSINSLNSLAQNSNMGSTISGMISNLSQRGENKEIIDALKFLQQFTTKDGSLDTTKLVKALEGKGDSSLMGSMQFAQQTASTQDITVKHANIFKQGDIVDVVVENFKTLRLPGRCEMRIKLNPQELGEITIKLVLEKGQISASISADKKETFALLQNNLQQLQEKLQSTGVDLHHVSVNLSQEDGGEEARRGFNGNSEESNDEEFESIFEDALEENI
ncbi:MAG: flagellar hook-length control protein FliK [Clostridium sp.]|uniref:flagellar hook-length control protein FliK n=1 Tax=Clostridium sp. TaxID=1506 RepID=UPI002FCB8959